MAPNNKMWLKRYLIPIWLVELIVLGIYFILACVGLSAVEDIDDYLDDYLDDSTINTTQADDVVTVYRAVFAAIVTFASLCLLLTFIEIGCAASHKLKPTFHLVSACIKALISVVYFIIVCVGSASVGRGYALDIILSLALTLATLLQVIYGSVIVHRVRKGVYSAVRGGEGHGDVTYKGHNDVELQSGGGAVYR